MLVPTLMLVSIVLAGIAIDLSLIHGAHRSTHRVVSSAADDAAGMLDERQLQLTGELRIDPERARSVAMAHVDRSRLPGSLVDARVVVSPAGDLVEVTVEIAVQHVVLRAAPGHGDQQRLVVTARSRLHR